MNIAQIEENVKKLLQNIQDGECKYDDFIYQLLLSYGHRKQSVSRLRSGERNLASNDNQPHHDVVVWKRHVYFKQFLGGELHSEIDRMKHEKLHVTNKIRFLVVTDFEHLLAIDTKTFNSLDIELKDLTKQFDFFLPWAGMEKAVYQGENPADVKAAEKMARLFDIIKDDNFDDSHNYDSKALHNLNVFLTRLLFCFFAEDTEIFQPNQFSLAIQSHTEKDGSNLATYLDRLFQVMNTRQEDRSEIPEYLAAFPYVNGGLFAELIPSPKFSAKSRRMLIECGSELDWSDINPDIFGSMIQAVVHPEQRGNMGMHYTSVTNIMKVIEPLFLNELYEELEKAQNSSGKLQKLQLRLAEIKIFDPACGSGNFLIIAYKELRKLELELLKRQQELELEKSGQYFQPFSVIKLSQFYGIELDDFAHEVAILSLWLAEHQMNQDFRMEFGEAIPTLPLKSHGKIISGNATRVAWSQVCPDGPNVYILGNPPYLGSNYQSKEQKSDLESSFLGRKGIKNLDYVSCWFVKAAEFIAKSGARSAFVSTNSLTQGEQVAMLWPIVFEFGIEISFAYKSFKWGNSAKKNAGVTCVIIGLRKPSKAAKYLYTEQVVEKVSNISPYLVEGGNNVVSKRSRPLAKISPMLFGSKPVDGGNLILSDEEKKCIEAEYPQSSQLFKKLIGADEYIKGYHRWCLWIEEANLEFAKSIPEINERINKVRDFRLKSTKSATRRSAETPHRFGEVRYSPTPSIIVPRVSSERREYLIAGFLDHDSVILDRAQEIPNATLFDFGVISSKMHFAWTWVTSGRLESRLNYSSSLCYNTFPFPDISETNKDQVSTCALRVIEVREKYPHVTMAELYDPQKMPSELLAAHIELDVLVDSFYKHNGFKTNSERFEFLFGMYEKLTGGQRA